MDSVRHRIQTLLPYEYLCGNRPLVQLKLEITLDLSIPCVSLSLSESVLLTFRVHLALENVAEAESSVRQFQDKLMRWSLS